MLSSYLRLAYRNLIKNRVSSLINLFGLSVAIGCCIVVGLFLSRSFASDSFHEHVDRLYLVTNVIDRDGSRQLWGDSPTPLGPAVAADVPQVERAVRIAEGNGVVQYGDKVFSERFWYADDDLLEVLTFPLRYGDSSALADPNAVIISNEMAEKYFGRENPMGEEITIRFGDHLEAFTIGGVAEPFDYNASFYFNMLLRYDMQVDVGAVERHDDWSDYTRATFLLLREGEEIEAVAAQMDKYLTLQNAASDDWPIAELQFAPLRWLHVKSDLIQGDIAGGPPISALIVLPLLAVFLLALACLNYINISLAAAVRRMKEIGVRKVMGSNKAQLVAQFLTENLILCVLALVLGILLAYFILLPGFNELVDGDSPYELNFVEHPVQWLLLVGILVLTGLASGAYPAFFISAFEPIAIFRGRQRLAKPRFMQGLLGFQFVIAFITMFAGVLFVQNARYQADRDWGYDQSQVLGVFLNDEGQYNVLADAVRQNPDVTSVTGGVHHLGRSSGFSVLDIHGTKVETNRFDVAPDYMDQMGIRLKEGRLFDRARTGDAADAIVINATFAHNMGWDEPIGQRVRMDSLAYSVVGVVEDFHYFSFFEAIRPTFFRVTTDEQAYRYLTVHVRPGAAVATADYLEETWKRLFSEEPYEGFFQDAVFDGFYRENANITRLFTFTALMALLISCMGLFGLAAQNTARRMKEISIRKVLGGSLGHVASLVNRTFLLLLLVAALIATPLSYFALEALLSEIYEFHVPMSATPFVVSFALIFATALLTIATQVRRIAIANPADVLRSE